MGWCSRMRRIVVEHVEHVILSLSFLVHSSPTTTVLVFLILSCLSLTHSLLCIYTSTTLLYYAKSLASNYHPSTLCFTQPGKTAGACTAARTLCSTGYEPRSMHTLAPLLRDAV